MRSLNMEQLILASGGGLAFTETMGMGAGIGAGIGANAALTLGGNTLAGLAASAGASTAVTVGSAAAGGVIAAGYAGYTIGTIISDHMPEGWRMGLGKRLSDTVEGMRDLAKSIDDYFFNGF